MPKKVRFYWLFDIYCNIGLPFLISIPLPSPSTLRFLPSHVFTCEIQLEGLDSAIGSSASRQSPATKWIFVMKTQKSNFNAFDRHWQCQLYLLYYQFSSVSDKSRLLACWGHGLQNLSMEKLVHDSWKIKILIWVLKAVFNLPNADSD